MPHIRYTIYLDLKFDLSCRKIVKLLLPIDRRDSALSGKLHNGSGAQPGSSEAYVFQRSVALDICIELSREKPESNALRLTSDLLRIDPVETEKKITSFIREYVQAYSFPRIVLGVSGGIDSAVSAALCAKAVGNTKILGLNMPEVETWSDEEIRDAELLADKFGIHLEKIDISPMVKAVCEGIPVFDHRDRVAKGNMKARIRMVVLYYYANLTGSLAVGSSDKSEYLLGYFTKWGDYCADLSPLTGLFKGQVRQLAQHLGVPSRLVTKRATPNLWPGQTAEDELGLDYDHLDLILYGLEHSMTIDEIAHELSLSADIVRRVEARCHASDHKRASPIRAKVL